MDKQFHINFIGHVRLIHAGIYEHIFCQSMLVKRIRVVNFIVRKFSWECHLQNVVQASFCKPKTRITMTSLSLSIWAWHDIEVLLIDQSKKSHYAPVSCPTAHHFVHISVPVWCSIGCGTGALWNLCNWSIHKSYIYCFHYFFNLFNAYSFFSFIYFCFLTHFADVMGTSATEGVGLEDAMKWLVDAMATNCLRSDVTSQVTKANGALQVDYSEKVAYGWTYWLCGVNKVKHWLIGSGQEGQPAQLTTTAAGWMPGGWVHEVSFLSQGILYFKSVSQSGGHLLDRCQPCFMPHYLRSPV